MADEVDDGKAHFRSFFAAELSAWLQGRNNGRVNALKRADWELRRNTKFRLGVRPDDDMTVQPPLSEPNAPKAPHSSSYSAATRYPSGRWRGCKGVASVRRRGPRQSATW